MKSPSPTKTFSIRCTDAYPLQASLFSTNQHDCLCIVAPALATRRSFYHNFCHHLAAHGMDALVFDYAYLDTHWEGNKRRGFSDVGTLDLSAVIDFVAPLYDKLVFIGHSLGAQALGFCPNNNKISRAITVAAGSGYYGWVPIPQRWMRYLMWCWLMPKLARAIGYYPGKTLGILDNLPGNFATEWSHMCCSPAYIRATFNARATQGFLTYTGPLLALSFADDKVMPPAPIDDLHKNFSNAQLIRQHIHPEEYGIERIGHMRAFTRNNFLLWQECIHWLKDKKILTDLSTRHSNVPS